MIGEPLLLGDVSKPIASKLNKRVLVIVLANIILDFIQRSNITFITSDFCNATQMSCSEYGMGITIFYLSYSIFQVPSNIMLEKFGANRWLALLTGSWGLVSFLGIFIKNYYQYYIQRLILGICEAGIIPGTLIYIAEIYPNSQVAFPYSLVNSAVSTGYCFSAFISIVFLSFQTYFLDSWQYIISLESIIALLFSLVILSCIPKTIDDANFLTLDEKYFILEEKENNRPLVDRRGVISIRKEIESILKNKIVICLIIIYSLINSEFYLTSTFLTSIVSDIFKSPAVVNSKENVESENCSSDINSFLPILISIVPFLLIAIGSFVTGIYLNQVKSKSRFGFYLSLLSAISFTIWPFLNNDLNVYAYIVLCIAMVGFTIPIISIWHIMKMQLNNENQNIGMGLLNSQGCFWGSFGPVVIGFIIEKFGYSAAMLVAANIMYICTTLFFLIPNI